MHFPLSPVVSVVVNFASSWSMSINGLGSAEAPESQLTQKKDALERNNLPRML